MLEDLEVFMAVEVVVVEEDWANEACFWSPGLGRPTLVAPVFIMVACQLTTPEKKKNDGINVPVCSSDSCSVLSP